MMDDLSRKLLDWWPIIGVIATGFGGFLNLKNDVNNIKRSQEENLIRYHRERAEDLRRQERENAELLDSIKEMRGDVKLLLQRGSL